MALLYLNCQRCRRQLHTGSAAVIVRGVRPSPDSDELLVCSAACGMKARRELDRWTLDSDAYYWEAMAAVVELGATVHQARAAVLELDLPRQNPAKWTATHADRFATWLAVKVREDRARRRRS